MVRRRAWAEQGTCAGVPAGEMAAVSGGVWQVVGGVLEKEPGR